VPTITAPPPTDSDALKKKRRYEFVVFFVWREPGATVKTPTDPNAAAR